MSDENLDQEIQDEIARATHELNQLGGSFLLGEKPLTAMDYAYKKELELSRKKRESRRLRERANAQSRAAMVGLFTSLNGSNGSFKPVSNAISSLAGALSSMLSSFGTVGKVLGSVVEAVGEGAKEIIDTYDKNFSAFEKLSDAGLINTFEELKSTSFETMITVDTLSKVLANQGKNLAIFGGGAAKGAKDFKSFVSSTVNLREQYLMTGYTIEEYAESQAEFMGLFARTNNAEENDLKKAQLAFPEFMNNIQKLSEFTGVSRKELRAKYADLLAENNFRAYLAGEQDKEKKDNAMAFITLMNSIYGPEVARGYKDMLSAGGSFAQGSEDAMNLMRTSQVAGFDVINEMQRAVATGDFTRVTEGMGKMSSELDRKGLMSVVLSTGKEIPGFISMARLYDAKVFYENAKKSGLSMQASIENQTEADRFKREKDASFAASRISMNDTGVAVNNAFLSADLVVKSFSKITSGIETLTTKAYEYLGKDIPAEHRLTMQYNRGMRDLAKQEDELTTLTNKRDDLIKNSKKYEDANQYAYELKKIDDEINQSKATIEKSKSGIDATQAQRGQSAKFSGSNEPIAVTKNLQGLINLIYQAEGTTDERAQKSGFKSGYDTTYGYGKFASVSKPISEMTFAEVEEYQRRQIKATAGTIPGDSRGTGAVGKGQFTQTTLNALKKRLGLKDTDVFTPEIQDRMLLELLKDAGLKDFQSGKITSAQFQNRIAKIWASIGTTSTGLSAYSQPTNRAVTGQIQSVLEGVQNAPKAKTGGIFKGPSTGYLVELHGEEMVLPANDAITKQNLQNGESNGPDGEILSTLFTMMDSELQPHDRFSQQYKYKLSI